MMRYSLKSSFFLVGWMALLSASLSTGNRLTCEAFVALQYLLFATSIAVVAWVRSTNRVLFVGFAVGFASFLLLVMIEGVVADVSHSRYTLPGNRIHTLALGIVQLKDYADESIAAENLIRWEAVIRSAFCTLFGAATAICASLVRESTPK